MAKPIAQAAPHSWSVSKWPAHVWPGDSTKGKRFCRTFETQLMAANALTRMGRDLTVLGAGFTAFMLAQAHRVSDFDVPCNRVEHAHKRNGAKRGGAEA